MAHFLLDYGAEHHVLWGCFVDATRECWWVPNPEVRAQGNPSMGRPAAPAGTLDFDTVEALMQRARDRERKAMATPMLGDVKDPPLEAIN